MQQRPDSTESLILTLFVALFPTLLLLLFFYTLNYNAKVLYAPSDFRDDRIFLEFHTGTKTLSSNLDNLAQQLETLPEKVVDQVNTSVLEKAAEDQKKALREVVNSSISEMKSLVGATQGTTKHLEEFVKNVDFASLVRPSDSCADLTTLFGRPSGLADLTKFIKKPTGRD